MVQPGSFPDRYMRSAMGFVARWRELSQNVLPGCPAQMPEHYHWAKLFGNWLGFQRERDPEILEQSYETLHWQMSWAQAGFPIFQLTHGLASALILTDCKGVQTSEVKWPFSSF